MKGRLLFALAALCGHGAAAAPAPRADYPWSSTDWHKYVRSPASSTVKPSKVLSDRIEGDVRNPDGLIDGSAPTELKRTSEQGPPTIVVDFGLNVVGLLRMGFEGSESGGDDGSLPGLKLAFSETLEYLTDKSDYTRSYRGIYDEDKLTNGTDQIAVKNEKYTWVDQLSCEHDKQVCSDGLHGFRYVKIWLDALPSDAPYTTSLGSVSISSIELEWSAYLGTPDTFTGWFECSDEDITQWWYDGVYTVDTNTDLFLRNETEPRDAYSPSLDGKQVLFDGAKRDRDPYVGDLAVASLTSYLSHDFAEATYNVLDDLALHQRDDGWIPPASIANYTLPLFDYPLWWVVCSVDLVFYTGDTAYAEKHYDVLKKVLDDFYPSHVNPSTDLLDKARESNYGDYAFLPRSGPITYYNALHIHALQYASQLAASTGHDDDASRWADRAAAIGPALIANNFDTVVGAFYDGGPCPDDQPGTICDVHAQDGNSLAILTAAVNATLSSRILDYWSSTARPYGNPFYDRSTLSPDENFHERVYALISFFELSARFATPGAAASALEELRRLYGWMASHDPGVTMWEGIGSDGGSYQGAFMSYSHGWSTGVTPLLTTYVLGVRPAAPGFSRWTVCPVVVAGDLSWAKGVVPTPGGSAIKVSWATKEDGGDVVWEMQMEAPADSEGTICFPDLGLEAPKIKVDGNDVGGSTIDVKGGSHTVTISK